jgi:hypothetical protein
MAIVGVGVNFSFSLTHNETEEHTKLISIDEVLMKSS